MPVRRPARHRSPRSRRTGLSRVPPADLHGGRRSRAFWVVLLLPAALLAGFYLTRGSILGSAPAAFPQAAAGECGSPGSHTGSAGSSRGSAASPCSRSAASSPAAQASSRVPATAARHHRRAASHAGHARHSRRPHPALSPAPQPPPPTHTAPPSPAPSATAPGGSQHGAAAAQVLALINSARSQAGLPAYTLSSGLDRSSSAHNTTMAGGCGLSHQCPGEPSLGTRETDAGVHWTSAGENIGEGGPVAGSDSAIAKMAVTLTQGMLNEKPPDDGHRLNILSSSFQHIGIAVLRDSSGTVWLTQDFSN
jgi:uncharacterized protein YkwD